MVILKTTLEAHTCTGRIPLDLHYIQRLQASTTPSPQEPFEHERCMDPSWQEALICKKLKWEIENCSKYCSLHFDHMGWSLGLNFHFGSLWLWPEHSNPARSDWAKPATARRAAQWSTIPTKRKPIKKIRHRKNHNNNKNHSSHPPYFYKKMLAPRRLQSKSAEGFTSEKGSTSQHFNKNSK